MLNLFFGRVSFKTFLRSDNGNLATTLGISLIPIAIIVGVSIDYGRAASARSAMQLAADTAALMVAKDFAMLSEAERSKKADAYFRALFSLPEVSIANVTSTYNIDPNSGVQSLTIEVAGRIANSFMSMASLGGKDASMLGTKSTVSWSIPRLRIALALDTTLSMTYDSKLVELKKAAKQLVEDFYSVAQGHADIYISIVPFADTVTIAPKFRSEPWLEWAADETGWDHAARSCKTHGGSDAAYTTKSSCEQAGHIWAPKPRSEWFGCVTDRDKNYDVQNDVPSADIQGTKVWPYFHAQYSCPAQIQRMTSVSAKKSVLIDKIDELYPDGATNQAIGLAWAWMTHTVQNGPYPAPIKKAGFDYTDVIVLLTDGANTTNRWRTQGDADERQRIICKNIKKNKIKIFVIQVATNNDPVAEPARACSSFPNDPVYFSKITRAQEMSVQFKAIFRALSSLRISG